MEDPSNLSTSRMSEANLEPGLLLQDVLADVLHLQQQSLLLGLNQVSSGHLVGCLAGQLRSVGLITLCLHHQHVV